MNRIIRISSQQSGNFTSTNNIVSFNIPPNTFDFSESYLELNCEVTGAVQNPTNAGGGTPIYNPVLRWYNTEFDVNNSMFVRRAQLTTTKSGVLEDCRRNDILQSNLVNYTKSRQENESFGYKSGVQGPDYTQLATSIWRDLKIDGSVNSTRKQAPINIPMDQLCRLGGVSVFPMDRQMGGMLELELNAPDGAVASATSWKTVADLHLPTIIPAVGNSQNPNLAEEFTASVGNLTLGLAANPLTLSLRYGFNDMKNFPFWVGANCIYEKLAVGGGTGAVGAGAANLVIKSISTASADGVVSIVFDQEIATLSDAETLTGTLKLLAPITQPKITIISANLVLKQLINPPAVSDSMTYTTWEVEEYSQAASAQLNHTFRLPASCVNSLIMLPDAAGISRLTQLQDYRLSIDNVPIVNRAVTVGESGGLGIRNMLHYDLLMRSFRAGGLAMRNLMEVQRGVSATVSNQYRGQNTAARNEDIILIGAPSFETPESKLLQVNMTSQADHITALAVFKQVVRTIQF
tara:strand:+ start:209 stop:1768 length:1560 start_codon:yes stop_codon:yes gene_type:complete